MKMSKLSVVNKINHFCRRVRRKVVSLVKPFAEYEKADSISSWKKKYAAYCVREPVVNNWILYDTQADSREESFPLALFQTFQKNPQRRDYLHIWVIQDEQVKKRLEKKYALRKNVVFVTCQSKGYAYFLAKSKYLIADTPYPPAFSKREGQVFFYAWRKLPGPQGYEAPDGRKAVSNILRNLLMADHLLSADAEQTGILLDHYRLRHIYPRPIPEGISPQEALELLLQETPGAALPPPEKTRLLMYIGQLATNGVTSAAISLLKALDPDRYDVTVFVLALKTQEQEQNFDKIPPSVRVILRTRSPVLTKEDKVLYNTMRKDGIPEDPAAREALGRILKREFVRNFGDARFDHILDFSGYGSLFPSLATLGCPGTKFYMWQHSDMFSDCTNREKRKLKSNKITLTALRSCYDRADKIVSAAEAVYRVNRKNFATAQTEKKFTFVSNLVDTDRIHTLLCAASPPEDVSFDPEAVRFVTMGRCMPEKNHGNLIRALHRIRQEGHNATLHIIGDGPLREELEHLARELEIGESVIFTGLRQNPFAILNQCHCFVFPSIYEAQGLAVLEARAVGLPIIVSNYDAVDSVLLEDQQFILKGTDPESIREGLMAYLEGKIPSDYQFDFETYNKKALKEFTALLS